VVAPADWKEVRLGDLLGYEQPTKYLVSRSDYVEGGQVPVLTAGKSFLLGYTDDTDGIYTNLPTIIFDDFTTATQWVDFEFKVKSSACKMLRPKNGACNPRYVFERLRALNYQTSDHKRHWISVFHSMEMLMPPLKEQEVIAEALSDADAAIESLDALIAKKRDVKQATMQQLLTGRTRLPGFTADWKEVRLGDIALVVMGQSPQSIYYNTREDGIPLIQGNADIIDRKSIRRIWTSVSPKVAEPGDVLITVRAPVGYAAIASEQVCLGRGVCAIQPHTADSTFVFHSLVYWEPKWKKMEQGSTFTAANSKEVNDFTIHVPDSTKEQEAIAEALTVMDDELEGLTEQVSKLRMVKEGMMQDLLTGKVRLV
jgi:restriction endonuclease S subunit